MTIEESKTLKVGDSVTFKVGRNEYIIGVFVGLVTVTSMGRMTLNDIQNLRRGLPVGRKVQCAKVKYIRDFGVEYLDYIPLRKISRYV